MNKIVCIDSNVAIWGIKEQGNTSDIDKTRIFLEQLDANKIQVLVPTIVIAEILVKEMPQKHPVYLKVISENFIVGDFNMAVAQVYGDLVGLKLPELKKLKDSGQTISNDKVKFDYAIAATAIFYGATCIYTTDGDYSLIKSVIDVRTIPDVYTQTTFDFSS